MRSCITSRLIAVHCKCLLGAIHMIIALLADVSSSPFACCIVNICVIEDVIAQLSKFNVSMSPTHQFSDAGRKVICKRAIIGLQSVAGLSNIRLVTQCFDERHLAVASPS